MIKKTALLALIMGLLYFPASWANDSVSTDSRIKTLVYNPNDVFVLNTVYGYQSSIEFAKNEDILTISVGERSAWQIVPSGQRLFIRAMEYNAHTNMTVITSKRTYLFDLNSAPVNAAPKGQVAYILRFYYPDEMQPEKAVQETSSDDLLGSIMLEPQNANYQYSYTGPDMLAPSKIFDDGQSTYFKLRPGSAPSIHVVYADGAEKPLPTAMKGEYIMVPIVASRFTMRYGQQAICIYNEKRMY